MSNQYILLWLEAPLQSWGSDSKFGRRDTQIFPTKSGIYGILLSALGARGKQVELLSNLSNCKQKIISYTALKKKNRVNPNVLKKTNRNPLLMDFHMVGSGYNEKDTWEKMLSPKKSDGSSPVGGGAKMTYRYYLQDAKFAVIQELPDYLAIDFSNALQNPIYDLYLGRKNCVPTEFIFQGLYKSLNEATEAAFIIAKNKSLFVDFYVEEGIHDDGDVLILSDVPLQFGDLKKYRDRQVSIITT